MILPINEKYRINSDSNAWIIQKPRIVKGELEWRSILYFADLPQAVRGLHKLMLRESDAEGIDACVADAIAITAEIGQAFEAAGLHVEDLASLTIKYPVERQREPADEDFE